MHYIHPATAVSAMVSTGRAKLALPPLAMSIRGGLAGASLAAPTSLPFSAMVQTNQPLADAPIFPFGLILIVLLGLDMGTGSFDLLPTLSNLAGDFVFTGLALYITHKPRAAASAPPPAPSPVPTE